MACQSDKLVPNVQNFRIYDLAIKGATRVAEGYAILSDSVWYSVNSSGEPSKYFAISFNAGEKFYTSDILYSNNSIYVLASIYSEQGGYVDLGIVKYTTSGEISKQSRIRITDEFKAGDLQRTNANYTITFPLYAKGIVLPSSELIIAFNYIGKPNERWQYALLHVDNELKLIKKEAYFTQDFYSWIYKIEQTNDGQFMLTRGGNTWYAIDQFGIDLQVQPFTKDLPSTNGPGNPILTNIIQLPNKKIMLTGHADQRNNDRSIVTNYDYWVVIFDPEQIFNQDLAVTEKFIESSTSNHVNFKELCFDSYLTQDDHIVLVGSQRGYNQTTFDLSAQVKILEIDQQGEVQKEFVITHVGGMEALFIQENALGTKDIIGRKFGFGNQPVQTFFRTIKNFTND